MVGNVFVKNLKCEQCLKYQQNSHLNRTVLQHSTLVNEKGRWAVVGRLRNGPLSSGVTESYVDAEHR